MTNVDIIESLSKDNRFKSICKKIAKKPHLADDLYQEFFLSLLEIKDERLIEAKKGGYLEVLCVGIISNIWGKRYRVKTYVNGSTSTLYEMCEFHNYIDAETRLEDVSSLIAGKTNEEHLPESTDEYDFDRDLNEILLHHVIDKYKESRNETERFEARVFYYSKFKYKNPKQFSRASEIPYLVCLRAYKRFKTKVKEELCKY